MSGLLRRIKRSRAADTGETSASGRVAGPDGAPTAETSAAVASSAKTTELPAGTAAVVADAPVHRADPGVPAGLDAAGAAPRVVTGRRGRLRRRLRYLRRARELMLRDLGGLLYEVHRTGDGDVTAHTATIGAKVERLAGLDAEAAAIETTLGATRGEAIVFEPGVGGACDVCGELYGSAARFCSHCGAPAGAPARVTAASPGEPRPGPVMPKAPAAAAPSAAEPARSPATDGGRPVEDPTPSLPPAATEPAAEVAEHPHPSAPNGRAEDVPAAGLSPGDPLAARRPGE